MEMVRRQVLGLRRACSPKHLQSLAESNCGLQLEPVAVEGDPSAAVFFCGAQVTMGLGMLRFRTLFVNENEADCAACGDSMGRSATGCRDSAQKVAKVGALMTDEGCRCNGARRKTG